MKILLFFVLGFVFSMKAQSKYFVSTSGNDSNSALSLSLACATIQHAIDLSVSGDTVMVQPGFYTENIIFNGKNIKVFSNYILNGDTSIISSTIIDGDANGFPVVRFINGENNNAQLNGFTIQNGLTATNLWGAGIHIHNWGTSPTVKNCKIKNNTVFNQSSGAGIYIINTEATSIFQNLIIENNVNNGGVGGFSAHASNFDMKNVIIRNNTGIAFNRSIGAGSISNHIYPVTNCLIVNNNFPNAISCQDIVFLNCTISNNNGTITFAGNSGIINSVIGTGHPISSQGFLKVKNSLVQDGQTSISSPIQNLVNYSNNISGDPKFIAPNQGNYKLQNSSNCIGYGINNVSYYSYSYVSPTTDLTQLNKPIPIGSNPDIGCYENNYAFSSPILLSIQAANQTANLIWNNNNVSNIVEYRIFRSTSSIPDTVITGALVNNVSSTTFSYFDNNLTNLTTYYYRIQARNSLGFWSGLSNQISVIPNIPPSTPVITSSEIGPRRNALIWNSSTGTNSTIKYRIFRGTQLSNLSLINDNYVNTSYIDTGLIANVTYYYQIAAFDTFNVQSLLTSIITLKPNRIWYIGEIGINNNMRGFASTAMASFSYMQSFASAGDTVIYLPGQYYENINLLKSINLSSLAILNPTNLTTYQNNTFLTSLNSNPLIIVSSSSTTKLNLYGLTIQNCTGQVLNVSSTNYPEINRVKFINNGNLGAEVIRINGNTIVKNCYFTGNVFATLICMNGIGTGFPTVQSCEFKNNGQTNQYGKSLMYSYTRTIIANNLIYNNIGAMINGGCNGPLDTMIIMHNTIVGNQGYGIVLDHCSGGVNGFFDNNIIENNSLGCLWFVSNAGGFSTIRLRNNKLNSNPYYTQNPTQYSLTWQNNDTISGFTFNYPINNVSQLNLPNYSNSIGSALSFNITNINSDFNGVNRPIPIGSIPDRGALENSLGSPSNAPPILNISSNLTTLEDQFATINFTGIDDGDFYSSQTINVFATSGNLNIINNLNVNYTSGQSTANITYTPIANAYGIVPITIKLKDNGGILNGGIDSTIYNFNITILNINDSPIALNDTSSTNEDSPISFNIDTNDYDVDNALSLNTIDLNQSSIGVQSTFSNTYGSWSVNTSGVLTYTPAINFNGIASVNYTIKDASASISNMAQAIVSVAVVNDAPVSVNNSNTTNEDVAISFNILTNDSDVDNSIDSASVDLNVSTSGQQNTFSNAAGTWSVNNSGILTYNPTPNYFGTASITYNVKDILGLVSNDATVNITVNSVNDAPISVNDTSSTNEDSPISFNIDTNDYDVDNALSLNTIDLNQSSIGVQSTFSNTYGSWSVNTSGVLTYTPAINFNGIASVNYTIKDASASISNMAQAIVSVAVVNDAPVSVNNSNTTNEDVAISFNILTNDSDVDNSIDSASVDLNVSTSGQQNTFSNAAGTWSVNNSGILTYNPTPNYFGTASITYNVKDILGLVSNDATVNITVNSVNDAPVSISLSSQIINENLVSVIGSFTTNDVDSLQTFTYTLVPGVGDVDNASFILASSQLSNIATFDFEIDNNFTIRVRSTDQNGLYTEDYFSIQVNNVNDIQINEIIGNTYCNGLNASGSISVISSNTNGQINFNWSGQNNFSSSNQNITNLNSGPYQLIVTDSLNSSTFNFQVSQIPTYNDLTICYVTGDTMPGNHNRIYFNNYGAYNDQYYQVLRESSIQGVFDFIGQVNAIDSSFLDLISNNQAQSFNYRVRSIDSCGNMSNESTSHKTILLQANLSANNSVNLTWTAYDGLTYGSYSIYRSINNGVFQLLITLPASNQSFNDVTAAVSQNDYSYFVSINVPSCDFLKNNQNVMSNLRNLSSASLNEINLVQIVEIYPNPTNEKIYINNKSSLEIEQSVVYDVTGKLLKTFSGLETSLLSFTPGSYFVKVNFKNGQSLTRKISKM